MSLSRRRFMTTSAMAAAGLWIAGNGKVYAFGQSPRLRRFIQPLPGVGPTGIPVASANTRLYTAQFAGGASTPVDFYRIVMGQYQQWMHPDLPGPTKLWGYADATNGLPAFRYLGPAIVATRDKPVRINFINLLPPIHPLPVDNTIPGAETGQHQNRAAIHMHGGFVPWTSDGGPFHWFTPSGAHGPSLVSWLPNALGIKTDDYWYPNQQSARLMWYHDHAVGITRLNAYAGLAAPYIIVDSVETDMVAAGILPDLVGIPLALQDKSYKRVADRWGLPGDLWYPHVYEGPDALGQLPDFTPGTAGVTGRWDRGGAPIQPLPTNSCIPEFYADNIVVNGAVYPYVTVPRRRVRFRLLNGSQARVFNLSLWYTTNKGFIADLKKPGPPIVQIGSEGGFLPAPAVLNNPPSPAIVLDDVTGNPVTYNLLLAGAERADVVIDFSGCPNNSVLMLYNDAPSPFPGGDPRNDYYPGSGDWRSWGGVNQVGQNPAFGPDTRGVLQIRVVDDGIKDSVSYESWLPAAANALAQAWNQGDNLLDTTGATVVKRTLNEDFDQYGRLIQRLGTTTIRGTNNEGNPTYSMNYADDIADDEYMPAEGETQIWEIYNQTGDTHPIHFHIVTVKVLGRAPFDASAGFTPIGALRPPDANEMGWKETVRMNPGEVTVVAMRFDLPKMPSTINNRFKVKVPTSPRPQALGKYEYVWHCHILEHEEHDMMRPLVVTPKP
jgi:spore coat protein A, manganese oxidase